MGVVYYNLGVEYEYIKDYPLATSSYNKCKEYLL